MNLTNSRLQKFSNAVVPDKALLDSGDIDLLSLRLNDW